MYSHRTARTYALARKAPDLSCMRPRSPSWLPHPGSEICHGPAKTTCSSVTPTPSWTSGRNSLTASHQAPEGDVVTSTVLFTDIVSSTEQVARLGTDDGRSCWTATTRWCGVLFRGTGRGGQDYWGRLSRHLRFHDQSRSCCHRDRRRLQHHWPRGQSWRSQWRGRSSPRRCDRADRDHRQTDLRSRRSGPGSGVRGGEAASHRLGCSRFGVWDL